eukprot:4731157-Prorocentrum_lima.AAC.1
MTSSLVGSEMCIRDSAMHVQSCCPLAEEAAPPCSRGDGGRGILTGAVSYTHLTLPTICSV